MVADRIFSERVARNRSVLQKKMVRLLVTFSNMMQHAYASGAPMYPLRDERSFRGLSSVRRKEFQEVERLSISSLVVTSGVYGNGAKASGGLEITHFFVGGGVK